MPGASPLVDSNGVVTYEISVDGSPLGDAVSVVSITVKRQVNTIPVARIEILDGDMPNQDFPVSAQDTLKPGGKIVVKAGYASTNTEIFKGVITRHGVRVSGSNEGRLIIECRDEAVKLTVGRKNANYVDQKDSDIISALASATGLTTDVEATTTQHRELVQYYCSDWDFLVSRAEANGLLVIADDGKLVVKAPQVSAEPVLSVTYGTDLIQFQADMDVRSQVASVQARAWNPANQAVEEGSAAAPSTLNAQGNLDQSALAQVIGLADYRLQSMAALAKDDLTAWAKAQQVKAGLARILGSMTFQGSAVVKVGVLIEVAGVGARFNGKVFVGGLEHRIVDGNWTTEVRFGLAPDWILERPDVVAPPAAGWLPGSGGLHVGVVKKLDGDPAGESRIQVSVPVMQAATEGVWARLAKFHGSNGFGAFFVPEVGDEVVLGFLDDDPSHPIVLGSLYSSKHKPPYELAAENNTKAIVTRAKLKIEFDEAKKVITIETPAKNRIVLSDDGKSILLEDQNSNKVELGTGGITLDSPKDIKITAKGGVTIDAVNAIAMTSKADVKASGMNVNCEAQVGFVGKGAATAELSASGQTTVKGAMVMIN